MSQAVRCTILRGGTSKGVYLLENDLPQDPAERDRVILRIFGSPDKRQINGLGGADPLTSKVAVVGPSQRADADIEYTFGQVAIDHAKVYYKSLCGNITSGVGPFAINMGLVKAAEPVTAVRMYNRNTGKILTAEVPVKGGRFWEEGDYAIAGVPGTGSRINVDFSAAAGALTGKFLPTGRVKDSALVKGLGTLEISIVDMSTCQIFVRASDMGLQGTEMPADVDKDPALLARLEAIRAQGAYLAGLISDPEAAAESRNTPHLVLVSPARDYVTYLEQKRIAAADIDFTVRMMFMQIMHKTYAGTGSICTAIAALTPGTIANEFNFNFNQGKSQMVRLGHPGGVIEVEAALTEENGEYRPVRAAIGRTARQIMTGQVFI